MSLSLSSFSNESTSEEDFRSWPEVTFDIHSIPLLPLTHPTVPITSSRDGPRILNTHLFTPTWIPGAPTELFVVLYSRSSGDAKHLESFRVHLRPSPSTTPDPSPSNSDSSPSVLELALVDATYANTSRIPWDPHCITNSGRMNCVRDSLRCFSLFDTGTQPVKKFAIPNHPWVREGNPDGIVALDPIVTSTEPWSGAIAVFMQGTVRLYRIE